MALRAAFAPLLGLLLGAAWGAAAADPQRLVDPGARELEVIAERHGARVPDGFGRDARALRAWLALEDGQPIAAREIAERMLVDAAEGHCLLARVLLRAEGDAAGALRRARRCRALLEARDGAAPGSEAPRFWHRMALFEGYAASDALGLHAQTLDWLDALETHHPGDLDALRAWPLMSLGRHDEARAAADRAIERNRNATQVAKSYTALCAIESALDRAHEAYEACARALERGRNPDDRGARLVNLAESARALGRVDEVEGLLLEATRHFSTRTIASPWLELTALRLDQGRFGDALEAWREAASWRARQPAALDVHARAMHERASALFLLASGRPVAAARLTAGALARPDRGSETSVDADALLLASALVDRAAHLDAAERARERARLAPLLPALQARAELVLHRLQAWQSERRIAARLTPDALRRRIAPYASSEIELPEWLEPDLVAVVGPGVAGRALREAGASDGHARVWACEIAAARQRWGDARRHAEAALSMLPRGEALLRARAAARASDAARRGGDTAAAARHAITALGLDPGALRRVGAALPVRIEAGPGEIAAHTAALLARSPRLVPARDGLHLELGEGPGAVRACLRDRSAELHCSRVERRAGEPAIATARRLAWRLHEQLLTPDLHLDAAGITAVTTRDDRARLDRLIEELSRPPG